jgi:glutathione S-transferase
MSEPILYGFPRSTYVRTARMALEEKGVAYRMEPANLGSEEYQKLHPYRKMPAFQHGDVTLYETLAITSYIDGVFAGPPLEPRDPVDRAFMLQWISVIGAYAYDALIRRYAFHYIFPKGADNKPDQQAIEAALPDVRRQLKLLEEGYGSREYLVGDQVTLADLFLAPILVYVSSFPEGKEALAGFPGVQRGIAAMHRRESFQKTIPQAG